MITENQIIKNSITFDEEYVPKQVIGREKEITEISACIRPMFQKINGENLFIYGPPGIGKTLCVKTVLNNLETESSKIKSVYINCWNHRTRSAMLYTILNQLYGFAPRRGLSADELIDDIKNSLREYWGTVIVLDEIDKSEDKEIIYDLSRTLKHILIIGLSNLTTFEMDKRILSAYTPKTMKFEPYTISELKQILLQRAKEALVNGTYNDEIIGLCAAIGYNADGDARISIKTLFSAARKTQFEGKDKISIDTVQEIKSSLLISKHTTDDLDGLEKDVYETLDENGNTSTEINQHFNVTDRTIRNILNKLIDKEMIKRIKIQGKGNRFKYVKIDIK